MSSVFQFENVNSTSNKTIRFDIWTKKGKLSTYCEYSLQFCEKRIFKLHNQTFIYLVFPTSRAAYIGVKGSLTKLKAFY